MRRLLAVATLLVTASAARADFGTNLEEGEKESKSRNKLMLVYIWSPTCHVCKGLNEKVWPNIAVQTELENWAAVKMEATDAAACHYKWKIDDMPQLRVISPEGTEFKMVPRGEIPEANPDKMLDFLAGIRAAWDQELAGRKFMWEASYADAKAKSKERQRPILIFVHDGEAGGRADLNAKYPQFTDPACAGPAKKFVCVAATKDATDVWDKFKPQVVPGFIFVDLDGAELGRCGFLDTAELAAAMNGAVDKFATAQNVDPAKKLERDIASYESALKGTVEQDKVDAAQRLIDSKDPKVVKPLTLALKDASVKLKDLVIAPILQLDVKNGLPVILAWIKTESNNKLVIKAWDAIGETGDLRAVGPAEDSILDVPSQDVSRARIRALGNMKHKEVVDFLIDLPFKFKGKGGRGPGGGGGLREECKRSLNKLTGEDYGEDWNEWKKWWRDHAKSFKFQ
jgi:thioredoxin-related protein